MHMVEIQLVTQKPPFTVLAHIIVPSKDVVTCKSHFERKNFTKGGADDESWCPDSSSWRPDYIIVVLRLLSEPIDHLIGLVIAIHRFDRPRNHHDQGFTDGNDVNGLVVSI